MTHISWYWRSGKFTEEAFSQGISIANTLLNLCRVIRDGGWMWQWLLLLLPVECFTGFKAFYSRFKMITKFGSQPERSKILNEVYKKIIQIKCQSQSRSLFLIPLLHEIREAKSVLFHNFNSRKQLLLFRAGVSMIQWWNSSDERQSFYVTPQNPVLASDLCRSWVPCTWIFISISTRQRNSEMRTRFFFLKAIIASQKKFSKNWSKPVYLTDRKANHTLQKPPSMLVSYFNGIPEPTEKALELGVLPGVTSDQFDDYPFSALRMAND